VTEAGTVPAARPRRVATIDVGTNTVRLLVVDATGRAWRAVAAAQRVTRLGEGQGRAGRLLDEPMRRTAESIAGFAAEARRLDAAPIRIAATSAVREAPNGGEFAARVRAATGLEVDVVSGPDEGRLTVAGVAAGLPALGGTLLLLDVGGGSTELVRAERGWPTAGLSATVGVVRLAERWGGGPVDWARFAAMRGEVAVELAAAVPRALLAPPLPPLVGTAGTVTTLAALDLELPRYDGDRVQGHRLGRPAIERLLGRLAPLTAAAREALPCVEAGRGDLLVPGIAVCLAVLDLTGQPALCASDRGLREGLLEDLLAREAGAAPEF
jgi:exopolyphosphatase/guanosine-5'-triphosphate,3'-diphosphate pyrophosphatase